MEETTATSTTTTPYTDGFGEDQECDKNETSCLIVYNLFCDTILLFRSQAAFKFCLVLVQ